MRRFLPSGRDSGVGAGVGLLDGGDDFCHAIVANEVDRTAIAEMGVHACQPFLAVSGGNTCNNRDRTNSSSLGTTPTARADRDAGPASLDAGTADDRLRLPRVRTAGRSI